LSGNRDLPIAAADRLLATPLVHQPIGTVNRHFTPSVHHLADARITLAGIARLEYRYQSTFFRASHVPLLSLSSLKTVRTCKKPGFIRARRVVHAGWLHGVKQLRRVAVLQPVPRDTRVSRIGRLRGASSRARWRSTRISIPEIRELPRGGVPVAARVAAAPEAPLMKRNSSGWRLGTGQNRT